MSTLNIKINGVVDTGVDVLTNINRIADAALCYVSWDLGIGKWSVIIKEPDSAVATFDNSNIVGSITVSGSGLRETYNSATIRFPHKDLDSESDYVTVSVPSGDRYPNELENELQMSTALVNDPSHAQYMASIELANSRLDQIIQFSTDFSQLGVTAGDLIAVNNSVYGFSNKLFRVQRVSERDNTDGTLLIDIVAQEYQDIYSQPLDRTDADRTGGIMPYEVCEDLQAADELPIEKRTNELFAFQTGNLIIPEIPLSVSDRIFTRSWPLDLQNGTTYPANLLDTGYSFTIPLKGFYLIRYYGNWGASMAFDGSGNWVAPNGVRKHLEIFLDMGGNTQKEPHILAGFVSSQSQTTRVVKEQDLAADQDIDVIYEFNKGDIIDFKAYLKSSWGPNHPESGGYANAFAFMIITGRVFYLGETYGTSNP